MYLNQFEKVPKKSWVSCALNWQTFSKIYQLPIDHYKMGYMNSPYCFMGTKTLSYHEMRCFLSKPNFDYQKCCITRGSVIIVTLLKNHFHE